METYSERQWLNSEGKRSSGTVMAYHGPSQHDPDETETLLEVSDCHCKIHLHKTKADTLGEFRTKLHILEKVVSDFLIFLDGLDS